MGGTPGRLLFSDMLRVLKLFKFPISGGRERRSFAINNKNIMNMDLSLP